MHKRNNSFKEVIDWAYKKQEVGGFIAENLERELNLTRDQFLWYVDENLIRLTGRCDQQNNAHLYILTNEGISKYFYFKKPWHEKTVGKILLSLIIFILTLLLSTYINFLMTFFQNIKNQFFNLLT